MKLKTNKNCLKGQEKQKKNQKNKDQIKKKMHNILYENVIAR
jgi:hypothetical protein